MRKMSKRKRPKWESSWINNQTYTHYYNRLLELAISMFEWKNLPDTVDPRFLELTLFSRGKAIFFKDEVLGCLALETAMQGRLDHYHVPLESRAYASNGYYNDELNQDNSVLIFNNYLRLPSKMDIEMFARRLYEIERTIDVNVMAQKTPVLIQCEEDQRLVLKNLYMQYSGNEPFIFGDKKLDMGSLKVLTTNAPYVADQLNTLKREIFNEALTYLGISNVNIQKKERLLADEVTRNMGSIEAQKFTRLNSRKEACEKINKMFGLNIDVEYREDIKMLEEVTDKGGEEVE